MFLVKCNYYLRNHFQSLWDIFVSISPDSTFLWLGLPLAVHGASQGCADSTESLPGSTISYSLGLSWAVLMHFVQYQQQDYLVNMPVILLFWVDMAKGKKILVLQSGWNVYRKFSLECTLKSWLFGLQCQLDLSSSKLLNVWLQTNTVSVPKL